MSKKKLFLPIILTIVLLIITVIVCITALKPIVDDLATPEEFTVAALQKTYENADWLTVTPGGSSVEHPQDTAVLCKALNIAAWEQDRRADHNGASITVTLSSTEYITIYENDTACAYNMAASCSYSLPQGTYQRLAKACC